MHQASIMRALGAGTRIFELLDRKARGTSDGIVVPHNSTGEISFEDIDFEYPGRQGVKILRNFNLRLKVGESVAIV